MTDPDALRLTANDLEEFRLGCARASHRKQRVIPDEMATLLLAEFDVEKRFRLRKEGSLGKAARGLELFEKAKADSGT